MRHLLTIRRFVVYPVIAVFLALSAPMGLAQAKMVGTGDMITKTAPSQAQSDRALVMQTLKRDDVRSQLTAWGVSPAEAEKRVAALSDAEISKLANSINQDPAGQGAIGAVVGAVVFIFVVLLITDLLDLTDVFEFDN